MLIELWSDSYAPGMIQGKIVNQRKLAKVMDHLRKRGQGEEETFLLSEEDSRGIFGDKLHDEAWQWGKRLRWDEFEVLTFYGYDCNTLKL